MCKAPGTQRLKQKHDAPLSSFAFKFNLRRYNVARLAAALAEVSKVSAVTELACGRGLHPSTS
jgi:hypothetical protein